jgi:hypothetical protein
VEFGTSAAGSSTVGNRHFSERRTTSEGHAAKRGPQKNNRPWNFFEPASFYHHDQKLVFRNNADQLSDARAGMIDWRRKLVDCS